jgi:hypothetical protein
MLDPQLQLTVCEDQIAKLQRALETAEKEWTVNVPGEARKLRPELDVDKCANTFVAWQFELARWQELRGDILRQMEVCHA